MPRHRIHNEGYFGRSLWVVGVAFCVFGLDLSHDARAQSIPEPVQVAQSNPFSALVGEKRKRREIRDDRVQREKYILASSDRAFLFESRGEEARLKFLCEPDDLRLDCFIDPEGSATEIYVVTPIRGPRGDIIYKAADGTTLLRIASYGGATVYWPGSTVGSAASKSFGEDLPLVLQPYPFSAVLRRATAASALLSARTGEPLVFDVATDRGEKSGNAVLADAIVMTAKGLNEIAVDATGAKILGRRIDRVRFVRAEAPTITLQGSILKVEYVPDQDIGGRLTSSAIVQFLENTL